jgi:hypothetical protein
MAEARVRVSGKTYALSTVTPPAGNGLRFREGGVTYEIEAIAVADPSASPVRFDHPTLGTLALVGSPLPLNYTELLSATFTVTDAETWEEKDLSGYGVPGGCVVEIRIEYPGVYSDGDLEAYAGVRQVGSALSRWISIQPYYSGLNTVTMLVTVDANRNIQQLFDGHNNRP